jgi:hypothetical protein
MTPDEKTKLEAALDAEGSPYKDRMVSFDFIGDNPNDRAVNLVAHYPARQTRDGKVKQETQALQEFAAPILGRPLTDNEIVIRAIQMPEQSSGRGTER